VSPIISETCMRYAYIITGYH